MTQYPIRAVLLLLCLALAGAQAASRFAQTTQKELALEILVNAIDDCLDESQQFVLEGALVAIYGSKAAYMTSEERLLPLGSIMNLATQRLLMHWQWCDALEYGIRMHAQAAGLTAAERRERIESAQFARRCREVMDDDDDDDTHDETYYSDSLLPGAQCLIRANRDARFARMAIY